MRILQINSHYDQGGAARIVAYIHRQLQKEGQESYVAYGRGQKSKESNVYRFDLEPEIYFSAAESRLLGIHGWANGAATLRLVRFIEKVQPDVIHLHALHGYYLNYKVLFDYINTHKIPCVWTFHDCHAFTGNCGYYFACEKWKEGCGHCPQIDSYPASMAFDFTAWMWKRKKEMFTAGDKKMIVTPSKWLTEQAKQSYFGKYPCITIHNGIDAVQTFTPKGKAQCRKKYGFGQEEKLILGVAVGFKDPRKGAKYIIEMAKSLEQEAKVILVGWNKENDSMLEGVKNIVTVPNTRDTGVLAEYYSMADVFVLPSLAENYATVTLEAMACGTPVVGFSSGGIPEQLEGNRGIVVETGNQKGFDQGVRLALEGRTLDGSSLLSGEALAECIRRDNSLESMAEQYRKVYESLLKRD